MPKQQKPPRKDRPLTPKQKKLLTELPKIEQGLKTKKRALLDAGYAESSARQQQAILGGLRNNRVMQEALRKAGVTEEMLAKSIRHGLKATRTFSANFEIHEAPDFHAQHAFVKTAAELLDVFPAEKHVVAETTIADLIKSQEQ